MWYSVSLPYADFSIQTNSYMVIDATVIKAPPIAKWMIGKRLLEISAWVKSKNGSMYQLSIDSEEKK